MDRRKLLGFLLAFILLLSSILPSGNGLVKAQDIDASSNEITSEEEGERNEFQGKQSENSEGKKKVEEQKEEVEEKKEELDDKRKETTYKADKTKEISEPIEKELTAKSRAFLSLGDSDETTYYTSRLYFADPNRRAFYGGERINLYNQVVISGNSTILPAGSYTLIYLPKDKFSKPVESDFNTTFETFKNLSISENSTNYIIKTSYLRLKGGYNGSLPFNVSLLPHLTVNASENTVKQEFYDASGKKLSESQLNVQGKALIEDPEGEYYEAINLENKVDKSFIVKKGTSYSFPPRHVNSPIYDYSDPRDRRVSVKIPKGLKLVDPDNTWTYDKKSDTYYKDINRDQIDEDHLTAKVDIGSLDLSDYPSKDKAKSVRLDYSLSAVKDGIVQNDISTEFWSTTRNFYVPKDVPTPESPASVNFRTHRSQTLVNSNNTPRGSDQDFHPLEVSLPYDENQLPNYRLDFKHTAISSFDFSNSKDENDPKLTITSTETDVSGYTYPSELRLNLYTRNLTDEEKQYFVNKLKGTKAYGVKYDGSKVLLTESVPIAYDNFGEYFKFEGSKYKTIEFEYPKAGLTFNNMAEIDKYEWCLRTDVIADFRPEAIRDLKDGLKKGQTPWFGSEDNVSALENYDDESRTYYKLAYKKSSKDTERTRKTSFVSADTDTYKYLEYNAISRGIHVKIVNGKSFLPGQRIKTYLTYTHTRYGNHFSAVKPENLNLYYLVPDGLEPIDNPEVFSQIRFIPGYREGYSLVIAKPKETGIPTGWSPDEAEIAIDNPYSLDFTLGNRVDIGDHEIYAALAIDNNKLGSLNQKPSGIKQYDTPSGLWEGITTSLDNRSETADKFTNLGTCSFRAYPPLVLSAFKEVKLADESDSNYASALGQRAHIGDEIDYRWRFRNNSNKEIKNLRVIDVLPYKGDHTIVANLAGEYPSRGSKFKTPLKSVEANEKFDFYYSTDAVKGVIEENNQANWRKSVEDPSKVTMIKAVLKPGQKIGIKEVCTIVTHNQIENNASIKDGDKAYNSFAYSLDNGNTFTEALKTEVAINNPKKDVLVKKVDRKDESKPIANVSFDLYSNEGKLLKENLQTNHNGELLLRDLLVGESYYLLEKSAPDPYVVNDQKIPFTVSDQQNKQILLVKNGSEKINIPVTKLWEDQDNKLAKRPESIKVKLLADGQESDKELILNEKNHWTGSFTDLAKYNISGEETNYSVKEVGEVDHSAHIDGIWYKVEVAGNMVDGFTITNKKQDSRKPIPPSTRNIKLEKKWLDSDGKSMSAPVDSIEVELYKDAKATGKKKTLKASNNWKASFNNLPLLQKSSGALIDYTVKEVGANNNQIELSGDSYKVSVTGSLKEGFTITNQLQEIPNKPNKPNRPTSPEKPNLPGKPDFPHRTRIPEKKIKEYRAIHKIVPKIVNHKKEGNPNTGAASFSLVPLVGFTSLLFMTRKKRNK